MQATLLRVLVLVLSMLPGVAALAQSDLPSELPAKASLSQDDAEAIARWAQTNWAQVTTDDAQQARRARRALVAPLLRRETTAGFRLAMDQALAGQLQEALAGPDDFRAVNAAILSGWLATDRSFRALTEALGHDRQAVQVAAAAGLGNAFRAAGLAPAAFEPQVGQEAVAALAEVLSSTESLPLLDVAAKALTDALAVPESAMAGFASRAGLRLTEAIGQRLHAMPIDANLPMALGPLVRAMGEIRSAITQRRGNIGSAWQSAVMLMYGRVGAVGFRALRAERSGQLGGQDAAAVRERVRMAVQVAQTTPTLLQLPKATQDRLNQVDLVQGLDRATSDDADAYRRAFTNLLTILEGEFSLPRDRFNIQ
ncbi:MAG: hypothetical protein KatS3mg103_0006 [Phycisphaerales bacterium]|nr:MAG: hypothetical protein KatS3mg103_0006 [Phycisphaerales bacterium]